MRASFGRACECGLACVALTMRLSTYASFAASNVLTSAPVSSCSLSTTGLSTPPWTSASFSGAPMKVR